MGLLWDGGTKVCSNGPGHMTKKTAVSETIVVYDLKLATNDQSDKKFLLTSKLCLLGAVCPPAPGLYIRVLNHDKNV